MRVARRRHSASREVLLLGDTRVRAFPERIERRARSAGDRLDGARRCACPPGDVIGVDPIRAKPLLCTSIYPSARDHPIPLASATYNGAHIHVPSLMSLERGRLTRARVRFRWTHSPRLVRAPRSRLLFPRRRRVPDKSLLGKPVPFRALTGATSTRPAPARARRSSASREASRTPRVNRSGLSQAPHSCG